MTDYGEIYELFRRDQEMEDEAMKSAAVNEPNLLAWPFPTATARVGGWKNWDEYAAAKIEKEKPQRASWDPSNKAQPSSMVCEW